MSDYSIANVEDEKETSSCSKKIKLENDVGSGDGGDHAVPVSEKKESENVTANNPEETNKLETNDSQDKEKTCEEEKSDDAATEPSADPYAYLQRPNFSSENFKIEIMNLPKYYGAGGLKRWLSNLGVNVHKMKMMGKYVFATFTNDEQRQDAMIKIKGAVFKGKTLDVKDTSQNGPSESKNVTFQVLQEKGSAKKLQDDYLHEVIKEVEEVEEKKALLVEDSGAVPGLVKNDSSSDEFENKNIIKFTARQVSVEEPVEPASTILEMELPWKRDDEDDVSALPVKQSEFPLWVENPDYTNYYSPTTTYLGRLDKKPKYPSVFHMFSLEGRGSTNRLSNLDNPPTPPIALNNSDFYRFSFPKEKSQESTETDESKK